MRTLIFALACAAPLLAAASARAEVTIVPAVSTPTAVAPSTAPVAAPVQPAVAHEGRWHQACDADVRRFCGGERSKPAVTACLDRNTDKLSPECKAIRADEERLWRERHPRR